MLERRFARTEYMTWISGWKLAKNQQVLEELTEEEDVPAQEADSKQRGGYST